MLAVPPGSDTRTIRKDVAPASPYQVRDMGSFSIWHILIVVAVVVVLFPNLRIAERAGRALAERVRGWISRPPFP